MAKEDLASQLDRSSRAAREEEQGKRWHGDHYHSYFEGWTEYTEVTPSGKTRIKRVYTAEYYSPKVSKKSWRLYKLLYFPALAVSFAIYSVFAYKFIASNTVWYVALPQALSVFGYIFAFWFAICRAFAPMKLTIKEHREAESNLKMTSLVLAVLQALTAVLSLVHCLFYAGGTQEAIAALAFLVSAGVVFLIFWNERKIEYVRMKNENLGVDGSPM